MENLPNIVMATFVLFALTTIFWSWLSSPVLRLLNLHKENKELKAKIEELSTINCPEISEHLPELIRLCHPDRHGNNNSSNKITKWLLSQR